MITGKTSSGFEFEINEKSAQDVRLVDAIVKADSTDLMDQLKGLSDVCLYLLGKDQKDRLTKHLADTDPDGIPTIEAMTAEVKDLFSAAGESKEIKNS